MKVGFRIALAVVLTAGLAFGREPNGTSKRFFIDKNGGGIELVVNDPENESARDEARQELQGIAKDKSSIGSPAMQEHANEIDVRFEKTDRGGRLRINAKDREARLAIQEFLRSQMGRRDPKPVSFSFIANTSLVAIPVLVNYEGPYWFLLDTGASHSIVSANLADGLKIKIGRKETLLSAGGNVPVTMRTIDTLEVGDALLEKIEMAVANFSLLRELRVDGILGADYLRRFKVAIDYEKRLVQIESSDSSMALA
jgi:hypothetical protein